MIGYNLHMDKLKIIIEEPTGSRRTFLYNTKSEKDTNEILQMVRESLRPGFSIASHTVVEEK